MGELVPLPKAPKRTGYVHTQTFFQNNRWDAHAKVGELMARGVTQIALYLRDNDWQVSWVEATPPDVLKAAAETDPC